MSLIIKDIIMVNEGLQERSSLFIVDDHIEKIYAEGEVLPESDMVIDGKGKYLLPGVIDEHVHFRDPGLVEKADIMTESIAAAAGGVTSFFDMPNTKPATTSKELLFDKLDLAKEKSVINYAFFYGASNKGSKEFGELDWNTIPGIKVFMGASTGNMLVDDNDILQDIFANCGKIPVMTHCEDSDKIATNAKEVCSKYGNDPEVKFHSEIRNKEVCIASTKQAIALAEKYGTNLLIAHVSSKEELQLISKAGDNVKAEVCVAYLNFCDEDYAKKGTLIKCNPALKTRKDKIALQEGLKKGLVYSIATDHAPHLLNDKQGGCITATSGMPMVQFSLLSMLQLCEEKIINIELIPKLMSHNPASFFSVVNRGFIREGYKADLVLVSRRSENHILENTEVLSKCGWTPLEGKELAWKIDYTICNGKVVFDGKKVNIENRGEAVIFNRKN